MASDRFHVILAVHTFLGFGYADFGDRQSLVDALGMNDQFLKNRKIKIDISTNNSGGDRDRRGGGGGFNDRGGRIDNNR